MGNIKPKELAGGCFVTVVILIVVVLGFRACRSCSHKNESSSETSSISKSENLNYQKACAENDYAKAHQILDKLQDKFVKKGLPELTSGWWYCPRILELPGYQDYEDADMYIFREEATYLMGLDDPAVNSRIIKLLMETPFYGKPAEENQEIYPEGGEDNSSQPYWMYYYCLKRYNQKCDVLLDLSILFKNESLAKSVLSFYKETMHMNLDKAQFDNQDKNSAAEKYEEAVRNGVFE